MTKSIEDYPELEEWCGRNVETFVAQVDEHGYANTGDVFDCYREKDVEQKLLEMQATIDAQQECISEVEKILFTSSQVDGSHHKEWVIDQIARSLLGDKYQSFIDEYTSNGEYFWSTGIAP